MSEALKREYQVCEEIGRGRFGTVFRCVSRVSNDSFAVKSIDKRLISGDSLESQCLLSEPKVLTLISPHPNIIQLYNLYEDDTHLHMILELCTTSIDLYRLIIQHGTLSESQAKPIMNQLFLALSHIHKLGVAHRDIKPDNILFDAKNNVKLSDFGSAEVFVGGGGGGGGGGGADDRVMSGIVGTPYYVAPEVLAGREYGEKVDVWSCGVVLYIMLAGFPPFYGETAVEVFEAVLRANLRFPATVFHSVSPLVKDLLRRMLCKDVSRRFSVDQVLRHPWMTDGGGT